MSGRGNRVLGGKAEERVRDLTRTFDTPRSPEFREILDGMRTGRIGEDLFVTGGLDSVDLPAARELVQNAELDTAFCVRSKLPLGFKLSTGNTVGAIYLGEDAVDPAMAWSEVLNGTAYTSTLDSDLRISPATTSSGGAAPVFMVFMSAKPGIDQLSSAWAAYGFDGRYWSTRQRVVDALGRDDRAMRSLIAESVDFQTNFVPSDIRVITKEIRRHPYDVDEQGATTPVETANLVQVLLNLAASDAPVAPHAQKALVSLIGENEWATAAVGRLIESGRIVPTREMLESALDAVENGQPYMYPGQMLNAIRLFAVLAINHSEIFDIGMAIRIAAAAGRELELKDRVIRATQHIEESFSFSGRGRRQMTPQVLSFKTRQWEVNTAGVYQALIDVGLCIAYQYPDYAKRMNEAFKEAYGEP